MNEESGPARRGESPENGCKPMTCGSPPQPGVGPLVTQPSTLRVQLDRGIVAHVDPDVDVRGPPVVPDK